MQTKRDRQSARPRMQTRAGRCQLLARTIKAPLLAAPLWFRLAVTLTV
jgi:hypothetical protein